MVEKTKKTSMYNFLLNNAKDFKSRTALIFFGKRVSFEVLFDEIDRMAQGLIDMGVKKGDSVTICLPNCPNAVVAFYAVNRLGAVANMVHPLTPSAQLIKFMQKTKSKVLFLSDFAYFRYKDDLSKTDAKTILCRFETYLGKAFGALFSFSNRKRNRQIDYGNANVFKYADLLGSQKCDLPPDDGFDSVAVYLHSGGTTGEPKTIMLSNFNFNTLSTHGFDLVGVGGVKDTEGVVMLSVLPMFHGFGLGVCIHMILSCGIASLLVPKFTAKTATSAIKKGGATMFVGVPTMFGRLLAHKKFDGKHLKNVTNVFSGADIFPSGLKGKLAAVLAKNGSSAKVCEGFGLTETVTVCAANTNEVFKEGSVGKPLKGIDIRAFDNEKGDFCEAGEAGEIVVSGETAMLGYLDDPTATAVALREHDGKVWVHTGDFGFVDSEGFVFFRQRIKRIVKISGVAVFPSEIEEVVTALPFVKHACAVGVAREKSGAAIKLFVELTQGTAESEQLKEQILDECRRHVIKWALPREIVFEKTLPLTQMGKVDYKKLEER